MIVYVFVSKASGKAYVGKTRDLETRICSHLYEASKPKPAAAFHKALALYGLGGFDFAVLGRYSREELDEAERRWISAIGSKAPRGYNLTDGGDGYCGGKHTPEWSALMSAKLSGDVRRGPNNPNYGNHKPWSEKRRAATPTVSASTRPDVRAKISASVKAAHERDGVEWMKGDSNPAKRPESRAKISAFLRGRKKSPETIAKQRASLLARSAFKRGEITQ